MAELVGFGEAMVLFESASLATAKSVDVYVAGAELNLCAAAARFDVTTGFCTRIGDDPLGARVLHSLDTLGIRPELAVSDPAHPTGLFLKDVQSDGQRRVYYYRRGSAASNMDASDSARLLAARPRLVAVSGITAALGPGPRAAVRALCGAVPLAFDPNFRPTLGDLPGQIEFAKSMLPFIQYLLMGTQEAELLFGEVSPFEAFGGELVLKAGPDGCYYRGADGRVCHQPSLAPHVVDPVGAGDAFGGAYLAARLRGATPAAAAWLGSVTAAAIVASPGDTEGLPTPSVAADLLRSALAR